jgi:hypothetical protein
MRATVIHRSSRATSCTSRTSHTIRTIRAGAVALGLIVLAASGSAMSTATAAVAVGTSEAGIVPLMLDEGPGGNAVCDDVPGLSGMTSSDRLEVKGNSLSGTLPEGLVATLAAGKRSVSWTSTFAISAVIVKGGDAANVYVYDPSGLADALLVAPVRPNGQAADVSNVTFCWDPVPPIDDPDLVALCMREATELGVGDIVSFAGPIEIADGAVVAASVPAGFEVTYDAKTDRIGFVAPFKVVVAIVAASEPVAHVIDPPSTTGTVPLSSNPGAGELVLCGLDTPVVVTVSCAQTGADSEIGPIEIREAAYDQGALPSGITSLDLEASIAFVSMVPVVGVIVEASEPVLYAFPTAVLTGSVPVTVGIEDEIDLTFCVLAASSDDDDPAIGTSTDSQPAPETPTVAATEDPTAIATGGGPSGRTVLSLFAFVVLALTGSSTMLLWSRGG